MKIAVYSPYLDTLGGGEKYMMTIAAIFSEENIVDVLLDQHLKTIGNKFLKNNLSERFNLHLEKVNFVDAPIGKSSSVFSRIFFLKKYDVLFYLTDGSIFYPFSKKNILHIQSPLIGQPAKSLWGKLKLKGWDKIIYNSIFTQKHSQNNWQLSSEVIYPPVDVDKIKPLRKKKYILSVGRFFGYLKNKKHEILIKTFKKIYEEGIINSWSLNLAGSAGEGDIGYINGLKNLAKGLPVNFYPNLSYDELIRLYGDSAIYWHASGFEEEDPAKMEHFGISTVEAMAAGCVPVVINKGGQPEIVEDKKSGFLWNNLDELEMLTVRLIRDEKMLKKVSLQAKTRAANFSREKFKRKILNII